MRILIYALAACLSAASLSLEARDFSSYEERVLQAYLAYYGRPADPGGLEYWSGRLRDEGGDLTSIIDEFGVSEEYQQRFGSLSNTQLVTNLYHQLFGRDPDSGGLNFYVDKLESCVWNLQKISLVILDGVRGSDVTIVNNRLSFSEYFVSESENGSFDPISADELADLMDSIGASQDSLDLAYLNLDAINGGVEEPPSNQVRVYLPGDIKEYSGTYSRDLGGQRTSFDVTIRVEYFQSGYQYLDKNVMAARTTGRITSTGDEWSFISHFWQESNGAFFNLVNSDGNYYLDSGTNQFGQKVLPSPLVPFTNEIQHFQVVEGADASRPITMGTTSILVANQETVRVPLGSYSAYRISIEDQYEYLVRYSDHSSGESVTTVETIWVSTEQGQIKYNGTQRSYSWNGALESVETYELEATWTNF